MPTYSALGLVGILCLTCLLKMIKTIIIQRFVLPIQMSSPINAWQCYQMLFIISGKPFDIFIEFHRRMCNRICLADRQTALEAKLTISVRRLHTRYAPQKSHTTSFDLEWMCIGGRPTHKCIQNNIVFATADCVIPTNMVHGWSQCQRMKPLSASSFSPQN